MQSFFRKDPPKLPDELQKDLCEYKRDVSNEEPVTHAMSINACLSHIACIYSIIRHLSKDFHGASEIPALRIYKW